AVHLLPIGSTSSAPPSPVWGRRRCREGAPRRNGLPSAGSPPRSRQRPSGHDLRPQPPQRLAQLTPADPAALLLDCNPPPVRDPHQRPPTRADLPRPHAVMPTVSACVSSKPSS